MQRRPELDIAQALQASGAQVLSADDAAQWQAQFPDKGFRAGLRAWARDAQRWMDEGAMRALSASAMVSWGEGALWWPAQALPPQVAVQHCAGGDWLPLQNPAALLGHAQRFRTVLSH